MSFFEAALLPDPSKKALCEELLTEFGVRASRVNDKTGEMVHACLVSPGLHRDQDKNPTASLNYKKLTYNCLGCGSSGGLLWFIATCRGETSEGARQWLEKTAGLGGQVLELDAMLRFLDAVYAKAETQPVPKYSEKILQGWAYEHPYLMEARGISEELYRKFRLGWDPHWDRVVIPHFWNGSLVGWQSRKLPPEWRSEQWIPKPPRADGEAQMDIHSGNPGSPKYFSSADFPKETTVFNYDPRQREAVVMEAMLSAITHDEYFHSEALFGAKFTDMQIRRLVKHERVILWMDNDEAGWKAVEGRPEVRPTKARPEGQSAIPGLCELLAPYTEVLVVDSPWSQDAQELPTREAVALKDAALPWGVWRRPETLYCYPCKNRAHEGSCTP
jgi:hypothetical protein